MSGRHSIRTRAWSRVWPAGRVLLGVTAAAAVTYLTLNGGAEVIMTLVVVVLLVAAGAAVWVFARRRDMPLAQRAGLILDGLSDAGFVTLHDLRLDQRRFDYVVVGPPGVFVARVELPHSIGISRREPGGADIGDTLTELHEDVLCLGPYIKPPVKPLLVTATDLDVEVPNNGQIVSIASLEPYLRSQQPRLKEPVVRETVAEVLRAATSGPSLDWETEEGVSSA